MCFTFFKYHADHLRQEIVIILISITKRSFSFIVSSKGEFDVAKRRTTIYIDKDVWNDFLMYLIEKHGKTHGEVISEEVENAIKLLIGNK